jgi:hypothetical protein
MTSPGLARQKKLPLFNSLLLFGSVNTNISLGACVRVLARQPSGGMVFRNSQLCGIGSDTTMVGCLFIGNNISADMQHRLELRTIELQPEAQRDIPLVNWLLFHAPDDKDLRKAGPRTLGQRREPLQNALGHGAHDGL